MFLFSRKKKVKIKYLNSEVLTNAQNGRFHRPLVQFVPVSSCFPLKPQQFRIQIKVHLSWRLFWENKAVKQGKKRFLNSLFDQQSCTGCHVGSSLSRPFIFFEWIALDVLFLTILVRLVCVQKVGNAARSTTTVEDAT